MEGHPASESCEQMILSSENKFNWVTSPITFYETYHVLIRIYGQEPSNVLIKINEAMELPIDLKSIDPHMISSSIEKSIQHLIDINDAVLLIIAINFGIPIIATDDNRLITACKNYGIICENPITDSIREEMEDWERKNLPEKGLGRIYLKIHDWLSQKDMKIAEEFKMDTKGFKRSL